MALRPIVLHRDNRGAFAEIFRETWRTGVDPVQWNLLDSDAGVLRGVQVHLRKVDYLVLVSGRASIGLRDLRPGSPTEGLATLVPMRGEVLAALTIPTGVAHGMFFHEPSLIVQAVSQDWDPTDELRCDWTDPALGIPWPVTSAYLSESDASSPPLCEVLPLIPPYRSS